MIKEIQARVTPREASSDELLIPALARQNAFDTRAVRAVRVLKRSIDARQRNVMINLKVRVYINEYPQDEAYARIKYGDVSRSPQQAVVVGAGPAGLFAALRLIEQGVRPIVVERGKNVRDRKRDLALISREHKVDPESNYSFGEGGAGAYSDGKLYTRSKKRGNIDRILGILCQHGANEAILSDAHPHIGTDKLPAVIENIREQIKAAGGEVHFETRMSDLLVEEGIVRGIVTADGRRFEGPVILATGHSARDVYRLLETRGIGIEPKGIAVGVRLEHPQKLIDQIQYHNPQGRGEYLPPAEYSFVTQVDGRGVYSFCMCPGGVVVPAASGPEQVVVNGMSSSVRGSRWANSGMVVEVRPEDLADYAQYGNLCMLHFQEDLERMTYLNGNSSQTAPAQRMKDFVDGKISADLPQSSYAPGLVSSPLHFWMPDFIARRLREGFKVFGRSAKGFLTNDAVLIAMETRTSAPVRVPREPESLQHPALRGLFPCGEGAGFAGGIVSAAMDGERCADALAAYLG